MSWDEALFGWIYRKAKALDPTPPLRPTKRLARAGHLRDLDARLAVVASALTGERVTIRAAESPRRRDGGGPPAARPLNLGALARGQRARVPAPRGVRRRRGGARDVRPALPRPTRRPWCGPPSRCPPSGARRAHDLPGFDELRRRGRRVGARPSGRRPRRSRPAPRGWRPSSRRPSRVRLPPRTTTSARFARPRSPSCARSRRGGGRSSSGPPRGARSSRAPPRASGSRSARRPASALPSGTERAGKARDAVRRVEMGRDRVDENPLTHSFEKVHTAEEYKGGARSARRQRRDERPRRRPRRARPARGDPLRRDRALPLPRRRDDRRRRGRPRRRQPGGRPRIPYDEWDAAARAYRAGWCAVPRARAPPGAAGAENGARRSAPAPRRRSWRSRRSSPASSTGGSGVAVSPTARTWTTTRWSTGTPAAARGHSPPDGLRREPDVTAPTWPRISCSTRACRPTRGWPGTACSTSHARP
jgi:hypothetical protein